MKRAGRHGKIRCLIPSRSFQRLIRNFVSERSSSFDVAINVSIVTISYDRSAPFLVGGSHS
jgi:hypothetical protein